MLERLMRAGFLEVSGNILLNDILSRKDIPKHYYLIVNDQGGRYATIRVVDLFEIRAQLILKRKNLDQITLKDIVFPIISGPIYENSDSVDVEARADLLQEYPLVVVDTSHRVVGLFFGKTSRSASGVNPEVINVIIKNLEARERIEPISYADKTIDERHINACIEEHDPAQPLKVGEKYILAFWLDDVIQPESIIEPDAASLNQELVFKDEENEVELKIVLHTSDFEIHPGEDSIRVPRRGNVNYRAKFEIAPFHEGVGIIFAEILKGSIFIQAIKFQLFIGPPIKSEKIGRNIGGAFHREQPRDLSLVITENQEGFLFILRGATGAVARIPITLSYLDYLLGELRGELVKIVRTTYQGERVFQKNISIPKELYLTIIRKLARLGADLFERVFYGPAMDAQANLMGDRIRDISRDRSLIIRVFSEKFVLPWSVLYLGDNPDSPNYAHFLGFSHIVEHVPLQPNMHVLDEIIYVEDRIPVSLNLNTDIDLTMNYPLVKKQVQYWESQKKAGVDLVIHKSGSEVSEALRNPKTPDQILYFYCHAISRSLGEGGPEKSALIFADHYELTLKELTRNQRSLLQNAPLIFINACESAELSPLFYSGFVPYFMAKGARGVIGTECEIPALFAQEWAIRFFESFLTGAPLGEIVLSLRQTFLKEYMNPLGLFYSLYVDGNTRISFNK